MGVEGKRGSACGFFFFFSPRRLRGDGSVSSHFLFLKVNKHEEREREKKKKKRQREGGWVGGEGERLQTDRSSSEDRIPSVPSYQQTKWRGFKSEKATKHSAAKAYDRNGF